MFNVVGHVLDRHADNRIFAKLDSKSKQMTGEALIKKTIDNLT